MEEKNKLWMKEGLFLCLCPSICLQYFLLCIVENSMLKKYITEAYKSGVLEK